MDEPSKGKRRRGQRLSSEERRALVVEACAELVATRGYAGASLREVAAAAGISIGTLLHHFATKDELLAATLVRVSERFHEDARAAMAGVSEPGERLRRLVHSVLDWDRQEHGWRVWMAFWYEASLNPHLSPVASARNEIWESMLATAVADARAAAGKPLDGVNTLAAELSAMISGVAIQRCAEPSRWTDERANAVLERAVDLFVAS